MSEERTSLGKMIEGILAAPTDLNVPSPKFEVALMRKLRGDLDALGMQNTAGIKMQPPSHIADGIGITANVGASDAAIVERYLTQYVMPKSGKEGTFSAEKGEAHNPATGRVAFRLRARNTEDVGRALNFRFGLSEDRQVPPR